MSKPRALILSTTTSNQNSYFSAGLSHFFELDVFYTTPRRSMTKSLLTRTPPDLYMWQYDKDCKFIECFDKNVVLNIDAGNYDSAFIIGTSWFDIFGKDRDVALKALKEFRHKTKKLYWLELGEVLYYEFGGADFWEMVDGVIKTSMLKKEHAYQMREEEFLDRYHIRPGEEEVKTWLRENNKLRIEDWYHKIFVAPLPPSITDRPALTWLNRRRVYDIAGNFQGNSGMRFAVQKLLQERLPDKYRYSFDYARDGYVTNYKNFRNTLNPFFVKAGHLGRLLFHFAYGKYFYPKPYYFHNLANAKCYLGLGHYVNSLRTADAWGAGTALINWDLSQFEFGLKMEHGVNYFTLGPREDLTEDNNEIKPGQEDKIITRVCELLSDEALQEKIIKGGEETFREYYASPKQYIKKFIIDKI